MTGEKNADIQLWKLLNDTPLLIGTKVKISQDNELKSEWPDKYMIVGINIDDDNRIDITLAESLNHSGGGQKPLDGRKGNAFLQVAWHWRHYGYKENRK